MRSVYNLADLMPRASFVFESADDMLPQMMRLSLMFSNVGIVSAVEAFPKAFPHSSQAARLHSPYIWLGRSWQSRSLGDHVR